MRIGIRNIAAGRGHPKWVTGRANATRRRDSSSVILRIAHWPVVPHIQPRFAAAFGGALK
jgi:hypothetical protein